MRKQPGFKGFRVDKIRTVFFNFSLQYLNPASRTDPAIHDAEEFKVLEQSMDHVGLSGEEKADIFRVVASVLHLGNIAFEENSRDKKGEAQPQYHSF